MRHTAVTHTPIRTAPRVPRRRTFGLPELAVLAIVALAVVGAYTVMSWVVGR